MKKALGKYLENCYLFYDGGDLPGNSLERARAISHQR